MTQAEFNKLNKAIDKMANDIMGDKGPEYTLMHDDVLNNFKSTAKDILITSQLRTAFIFNKSIRASNYNIDTINGKT